MQVDKEIEHLVGVRVGNGSESGEIGESRFPCRKGTMRCTLVEWEARLSLDWTCLGVFVSGNVN